jgi:phage internal scaffolding protein
MAIKENKFRTAYGDRNRVSFKTKGESLTQQHFEQEADVRNIIRQYDRTGLIANVQRGIAQYGDFSEVNEYREAMDLVITANNTFAELPSEIRAKFNNDAGAFFEFATDPKNKDEMVKMGLAKAPVKEAVEEATPATKEVAEPPAPQKAGE